LQDEQIGWQAGNWEINCRSIAICFLDDLKEKEPTKEAIQAAQDIIQKYRGCKLLGHKEVNEKTSCPGTLFWGEDGWNNLLNPQNKIAIDIVLLPDEPMTNRAVEVSERQSQKFNDKIVLHKEKCLPHISLAMGAIEENDLPEVNRILQEIASQFSLFKLTADSYRGNKIPSGETVSEFTVEKTSDLQTLHEMVMTKLKPFLSYDISVDMVFSPPTVEEITLYWIKNYAEKSSFENFKPHITVGFGELGDVSAPIAFTASTLALCHLGNYCTCRKVLFSAKTN